ncbi:hypothetical protein H8S90_10870 [Olivibacter sp. SDN3]|uniref:hypothetical protein n=1 Tax=Olivibacter sp. SDN3 TaxID=2764720 RepID=UPI00165141D8|nr:hypothetical protein [Olivibacter sp. SDN3]QNL52025.1 hypothetical protein H8S90_10870 [Olivibacter sp. SDN3]
MDKGKRMKRVKLTEHYLVPLTLFVLNICLMHTIYAFESGVPYSGWHKGLLCGIALILGAALMKKNEWYLIVAVGGYLAVLLWCFQWAI